MKPELLEIINQLSGEDIAQKIPVRKLIKAICYKIAAKPGFRWLYRFRKFGKKSLDSANQAVTQAVHRQYNSNFHPDFKPYQVKLLNPVQADRPRILHAIANFNTGGSAQLVVDIIEHLGHHFEQEIVTRYNPKPPCYVGPTIHEYADLKQPEQLLPYLRNFNPDLLHVHYWAEYDKGWYQHIFEAAQLTNCKVIENINVPVIPNFHSAVSQYVYVSNYVQREFGQPDYPGIIIHPGSNLSIFQRKPNQEIPDNCIGMVYRLDTDKVNERSIDVFIKVVQRRKKTRVLIVGGGSNLEYYQDAVKQAEVSDAFTFTGFVAYEQLPALYEQLSIFVAPVVRESFGQVTPFAMGMKIPVVGYNVGALVEILGSDELLAPANHSDTLADIIVSLLDDRNRRLQIGLANYERAHRLFSVEAMVEQYNKLYNNILKNRNILEDNTSPRIGKI